MSETILSIVDSEDLDNPSGIENAMRRMKNVPDFELGYYRVVESTNQGLAMKSKQAVALAAIEAQRRTDYKTTQLTFVSTILSGGMAILGVVIGVLIGGGN